MNNLGDAENTSTLALAQELFWASRKHNVGLTIYDEKLWAALDPVAVAHLLDVACAAEAVLTFFGNEELKLLIWNVAEAIYVAYHKHPFSSVPDLEWLSAPTDVKELWYRYADTMVTKWFEVKHLEAMVPWLNIQVAR